VGATAFMGNFATYIDNKNPAGEQFVLCLVAIAVTVPSFLMFRRAGTVFLLGAYFGFLLAKASKLIGGW
jgi:hypothetical protein